MKIEEVEKFVRENEHRIAQGPEVLHEYCPLVHKAAGIPQFKIKKLREIEAHGIAIRKASISLDSGNSVSPSEIREILEKHLEQVEALRTAVTAQPRLSHTIEIPAPVLPGLADIARRSLRILSEQGNYSLAPQHLEIFEKLNEAAMKLHLGKELHTRYCDERDSFFAHFMKIIGRREH